MQTRKRVRKQKGGTNGLESLHLAAYNGDLVMVKDILKNPKIDVNAFKTNQPMKGLTPLMIAVYEEYPAIVKELLQHPNIDMNKQTESRDDIQRIGETALHLATRFEKSEIVKMLLEAGADRTILDEDGMRPFHYATTIPNMKYLFAHPFEPNETMEFQVQTNRSLSPDLFAHFPRTVKYEINKDAVITALKSYDLCNNLNLGHVEKSIDTVDIVIVLLQNSEVLGICLMNVRDDLIIEVLCGHAAYKGIGAFFMKLIKQIAKQLRKNIFLCSERSSVGFYTKMDFMKNYRGNNSSNDPCGSMIPMVYKDKHNGGKRKTRRVYLRGM